MPTEERVWEKMYQKLFDTVNGMLKWYNQDLFESHNLKMYDAFYESGNYENGAELFERCMEDWWYDFNQSLKDEGIDFEKQIERIGRTSSFYLGRWHTEHWWSRDNIVDEMIDELLDEVYTWWASLDKNQDTDEIELYSRWRDESLDKYTDDELIEKLVDEVIEYAPKRIGDLLHNQVVMLWLIDDYKVNQVTRFNERVADRAEYDEVFNS